MAKQHRSKPHQIKLSETGKPHELPPSDWFSLVNQRIADIQSDTRDARIAVLRLPFVGWVTNGALCLSQIGHSIKSNWIAWERQWLFDVETITEKERLRRAEESFEDRCSRVRLDRESELFIEALDWQTNRQKKNRNVIRWVSPGQLAEVLTAFGRIIEAESNA